MQFHLRPALPSVHQFQISDWLIQNGFFILSQQRPRPQPRPIRPAEYVQDAASLFGRYQLLKTTPRRGGEAGVGVVDLLQVVFIVWPGIDLGWGIRGDGLVTAVSMIFGELCGSREGSLWVSKVIRDLRCLAGWRDAADVDAACWLP